MLNEFSTIKDNLKKAPLYAIFIGENKEITCGVLLKYCEPENSDYYFEAMIVFLILIIYFR
jgi:hypothetical protein